MMLDIRRHLEGDVGECFEPHTDELNEKVVKAGVQPIPIPIRPRFLDARLRLLRADLVHRRTWRLTCAARVPRMLLPTPRRPESRIPPHSGVPGTSMTGTRYERACVHT
jgi:hypothetical protein